MTVLNFDAADLSKKVEALSAQEIDGLPYGVVRLDELGVVQMFSATEAAQSGFKKRPAIGRDFWGEVAPCMAGPDMRGRVQAAAVRGKVDIEIGWIGDFDDAEREMQIRIVSADKGGLWLFLNRTTD